MDDADVDIADVAADDAVVVQFALVIVLLPLTKKKRSIYSLPTTH